jgi:HlyD family secretion protein
MKMNKTIKGVLIAAAAVIVLGAGAYLFRGKLFPSTANTVGATNAMAYATVTVAKGSITSTVSASGQLEPKTTVTLRPDSNMPTRKITKILVAEGQKVAVNQIIAEIDSTGLDLSLASAEATYQAQLATLANLNAKPATMDLAAASASLTSAQVNLESAQTNYDNAKVLTDKGLASKNSLAEYERALANAKAAYEAQKLSYENVKAQSATSSVKAQEAAVATADYNRKMAKLVLESTVIRAPSAGTVAEILVGVGDLVSPTTSIAYLVDTASMKLVASLNENDMPSVKVGQTVTVTQSAYSDSQFTGIVKGIDLHASSSNNVSTFAITIEVPNADGKLYWGMNADAEIAVVSLRNVLTLPSSAIKTSGGKSTVTAVENGSLVAKSITIGATDGSKTQIVSGIDEGTQVLSKSSATTTKSATAAVAKSGTASLGALGSVLGGGAGGPPSGL